MPIAAEKQNKERRKKLMQCAIELFAERGYFETPVRDIIARSGFGTGTFYNYFCDKEDILKALLEEFADQIIASISSYYTSEKDLYKRFIDTKRVTMEVLADNEPLSEIYCRAAGAGSIIDRSLQHFEDRLIAFYSKNIAYGIHKGAFRQVPVEPVAHSILAVEKYLLYKWIVLKAISKQDMIEMVVSFHETLAMGLLNEKTE